MLGSWLRQILEIGVFSRFWHEFRTRLEGSILHCYATGHYLKFAPSIFWYGLRVRTESALPAEVVHDWWVVDASQYTLGRLASAIAHRLRGKHKPSFTPHVDTGDYVVVVNAEQVRVTGRKETDKLYHRHTGYPGGLKSMDLRTMRQRHPDEVIRLAVKRMLPRNPLGRDMLRKLKVYSGEEHPHGAQGPKELVL